MSFVADAALIYARGLQSNPDDHVAAALGMLVLTGLWSPLKPQLLLSEHHRHSVNLAAVPHRNSVCHHPAPPRSQATKLLEHTLHEHCRSHC